MGEGNEVTSLLAGTYFINQRFGAISLILAIPIGFAAVSTALAQLH